MWINEQNRMKEDPFKLMFLLGATIFHTNVIKTLLIFALGLYLFLTLMHIYYIMFVFDLTETLNFGAYFLLNLFFVLAISTLLVKNYMTENMLGSFVLWSYDSAGSEFSQIMEKKSKTAYRVVALNTVVVVLWAGAHIVPNEHDDRIFFACYLSFYLGYLYKLTFLFMWLVTPAHAYQTAYVNQHFKFQIALFNRLVTDMTSDYQENGVLMDDEDYQDEMTIRMKFLIERHCSLIELKNRILSEITNIIVPFIFAGYFTATSVVLCFLGFSEDISDFLTTGRNVLYSVHVVLVTSTLITFGQKLQDESEKILTSLMTPQWYNWNNRNKKLLLIAMTQSVKPLQLQLSDTFPINYQIGISILRVSYAAVSLMLNIKE